MHGDTMVRSIEEPVQSREPGLFPTALLVSVQLADGGGWAMWTRCWARYFYCYLLSVTTMFDPANISLAG